MIDNKSMERIQQKFLRKLKKLIPDFATFTNNITKEQPSKKVLMDIHMPLHQIAGSAKTFGFDDISKYASKAESYIYMLLGEADKGGLKDDNIAQKLRDQFKVLIKASELLVFNKIVDNIEDSEENTEPTEEVEFEYTAIIADDDALVNELVKENVEKIGCKVITITDGKEVVAQAKLHKPDVIIQDVNMPNISGFDILKELKSNKETQDIPVLMLTKRSEDSSIIEGISNGALDYIIKPFDIDKLVKRISSILDKSHTTVMIADDDELIYELLSMRFRKKGYRVVVANTGRDALKKFQEESPDIILLDIMMPGMDGLAVLKQIKASIKADTPVVMLTTKNQLETSIKSFEEGAHDYITKPFDLEDLGARVAAILKRHKAK